MEQTYRFSWINAFALALTIPAAYFILINLLKFEMGINGPYDSIEPMLLRWGLRESFGWNINLMFVFGPVIAFCIAASQVVRFRWKFTKEEFDLNLSIKKKWFALSIALLSAGVVFILFVYAAVENLQIRGE